MQNLLKYSAILGSILACIVGCSEEFHPLTPPKDPPRGSICQPSSIEKNIIGTWRFESNYNKNGAVTQGTVTFESNGNIIDPDSLFENQLDLGTVTTKKYNTSVNSPSPRYLGMVFAVYQTATRGNQITYFTLVSNECNKIHLSLFQSEANKVGFILTK